MLGLIQDLYAMHRDNQTFLHARFGLGEDVLEPYKKTIDRWLWPDLFRKQETSVSKAKQAIAAYKKAVGEPEGLAGHACTAVPRSLSATLSTAKGLLK